MGTRQDSPYTEVKRFDWYRGYHVGGRSLMWGRQSYRSSDFDFEANAKEGIAVDWPIRYADIAPWYDHVERHAASPDRAKGCRSSRTDSSSRRCRSTAPRRSSPAGLRSSSSGRRRIIPGRVANLTQPLPGRGRCQYRNACWLGCPYGAYFSTQASTLPAAIETGRLTLKTFAIVTEVVYDRDRKRATGVRVIDALTKPTTEYTRARGLSVRVDAELHVAADAFGDRRLAGWTGQQLRRARAQPDGSPLPVRRQRHDRGARRHAMSTGAGRPASTFRASEICLATSASTCAGSVTRAAPAGRGGSARSPSSASARAFKDATATPGPWQIGATAFGEMLPNHANRISLDAAKTDKWGLPVLAIDCATGENERLMRRDMMNDMAEMLEATGVKQVRVFDNGYFPGMGIHEMGTARMGRDPKTSVLNAHNQVWDCAERVRHRRLVHDVGGLPESVAHLHGADGASRGPRRRRTEAGKLMTLTRRDVIQRVAAMLGGAALVGGDRLLAFSFDDEAFARAMAQGVGAFTVADVALLDEIAETILPETSTPGAKAAKTGAFMALMVTDVYSDAAQRVFGNGLRSVDEACRSAHGTTFMQATPAQRLTRAGSARSRTKAGDGRAGAGAKQPCPGAVRLRSGGFNGATADRAALLQDDEGTGVTRLLHIRDWLHEGAALYRSPRAIRSVRAS